MRKPNFLIIGAPKSGTTSLYHYLQQHPRVQFSEMKEPKYFSFSEKTYNFNGPSKLVKRIKKATITNEQDYFNLFKDLSAPLIGEASPNYFHSKEAAGNICAYNSQMLLIVILRNPVERLYSDWKHNVRMGLEPIKNFKKAIDEIENRKNNNELSYYYYLEKGEYAANLKGYLNFFPKEQIKVVFYDNFKKNPNKVCNDIMRFLGEKDDFLFNVDHVYMKGNPMPKSKLIKKIINRLGYLSPKIKQKLNSFNSIPNTISRKDKSFVLKYYRNDILELQQLTNKDLSLWLK